VTDDDDDDDDFLCIMVIPEDGFLSVAKTCNSNNLIYVNK